MIKYDYGDYDKRAAKLKNWLIRFPKDARAATAVGMFAAAQDIMALAREYAPIGPSPSKDHADKQPGKLRAAAYARFSRLMGSGGISVDMGFEGTFSDRGSPQRYMVVQHENTSYKHPQGGRARFLAGAEEELRDQTNTTIARYVNEWLKTGRMPAQPARKVPERGGG